MDSSDRGESPHHTKGSKAPRPTHFMICGTLIEVVLCGIIVGYVLGSMLVVYVVCLYGRPWESLWHPNVRPCGEPMAFLLKTMGEPMAPECKSMWEPMALRCKTMWGAHGILE